MCVCGDSHEKSWKAFWDMWHLERKLATFCHYFHYKFSTCLTYITVYFVYVCELYWQFEDYLPASLLWRNIVCRECECECECIGWLGQGPVGSFVYDDMYKLRMYFLRPPKWIHRFTMYFSLHRMKVLPLSPIPMA